LKATDVVQYQYAGTEYQFCCRGCLEIFVTNPEKYLEEIRDLIVCPSCLAEKPLELRVGVEHEGGTVYFCRCPHCLDAFKRDPARLLQRLKGSLAQGATYG
jgi:YHS domain-containing protein